MCCWKSLLLLQDSASQLLTWRYPLIGTGPQKKDACSSISQFSCTQPTSCPGCHYFEMNSFHQSGWVQLKLALGGTCQRRLANEPWPPFRNATMVMSISWLDEHKSCEFSFTTSFATVQTANHWQSQYCDESPVSCLNWRHTRMCTTFYTRQHYTELALSLQHASQPVQVWMSQRHIATSYALKSRHYWEAQAQLVGCLQSANWIRPDDASHAMPCSTHHI